MLRMFRVDPHSRQIAAVINARDFRVRVVNAILRSAI
ncbi:MAG: hypothetical protein JWO13_3081 [Acidobacteriales bacterium]|nr:hypothetical protein [Terriglobales bacterium]